MGNGYKTIKLEKKGKIITLTLNRPEVHNAFNDDMMHEIIDALTKIEKDTDSKVLLITGSGKSFSAGADLNWMKKVVNYTFEENLRDSLAISEMFYKIYTLPKPVVLAVNGATLGGGMGFVATADIVIAADAAVFGLSEVKIGLVPSCISPYLFRKGQIGIMQEYFLSGERFDSKKAKEMCLVNYIVSKDELLNFSYEKSMQLLRSGPAAKAICKKLFWEVQGMGIREAYDYTARLIAQMRSSDEAQKGMNAFLQKQTVDWEKE